MNLLFDPWIPVRRRSGKEVRIAPWQITETDDPVVALAAPRPDFNGALMQFLIGLLQTTTAPEDHDVWTEWLEYPPSPATLKDTLGSHADAFELDGEGPCFMQDFEPLEGEPNPIDALLIDAPTGKTLRDNTDHFVKRDRVEALCPACATTALFTLQANAPGGGVGHRTSMRGGGPLTTLVVPDPAGSDLPETLWTRFWLNVLDRQAASTLTGNRDKDQPADIFPWLAPTRTSEPDTGHDTTPADAHPLQMYWSMPRRIRIDWDDRIDGACFLCGEHGSLVRRYVTRNYGINYTGPWQHPLSPHYIDSKTGQPMPVHAQPDGLGYRHWLEWVDGTEDRRPARVVEVFREETGRRLREEQLRLWVYGYDMDNMKARCWYEATFPLILIADVEVRRAFALRVQTLIDTAAEVAGYVQGCIKEAWFKRPGDARGDTAFLKASFFQHTEAAFYRNLQSLKTAMEVQEDGSILSGWYDALRSTALSLFDYWAARGDPAFGDPRRLAAAHTKLTRLLRGRKLLGRLGIDHKEKVA